MEIQNPGLFQLVWVSARPPPRAAPRFGRRTPCRCPLGFQLPLHLGNRSHNREETTPAGFPGETGDYSILTGFWYGSHGVFVV